MVEKILDTIEREMSTTPEVFSQDLHNAFSKDVIGGPMTFVVKHGLATMNIVLTKLPNRVIALISLPTLHIRIDFTSGNANERIEILKRMDLYMQRGGG